MNEMAVGGNMILDALPLDVRAGVRAKTTAVSFAIEEVLFEPGEAITHVHFPCSSVISLVTPLEEGITVEVATIGNEGIVGMPLQAGGSLAVRAITGVAGTALRMEAGAFLAEVGRDGPLCMLVQHYTRALFGQISQAAACNRLHSNEARLSRWLLMSRDRVGTDEFDITLEFLGQMLGCRRPAVTLSAGILEAAGLIRHRRGHITICDRAGLEAASCECYRTIRALFAPPRVAGLAGA